MKTIICIFLLIFTTSVFAQTPPPAPRPPKVERTPRPALAPTPEPPPEDIQAAEAEALEFVKIVAPFRMDQLRILKAADPGEYRQRILDIFHQKRRLDLVRQTDPVQYESLLKETKLDQKSQNLSEQYRRARTQEEKARIKAELTILLNELFDIREQNKQGEIKHLEEELARLKGTMAERRKNKSQIVTSRMEELLDEETSLRW